MVKKAVNTGDTTNLIPYFVVAGVAAVLIIILIIAGRIKTKTTVKVIGRTTLPYSNIWEGCFMVKTEVSSPKIMSMLKALIISFVVTALLLLLLALLLYKLELKEGMVTAGIAAIYIISCFAGVFQLEKASGRENSCGVSVWGPVIF